MKELSLECKIGEEVKWRTVSGEELTGIIEDWDNGTAIIRTEDGVKAVLGE